MYRDFDKLCFALSRLDGMMGIRAIKELNTYEFYEHKKNLEDEARRKGKRQVEDGKDNL